MPTGIEVINDSGRIQISENYQNMGRVSSGEIAIGSNGIGYASQDQSYNFSDIVAFRCEPGNYCVAEVGMIDRQDHYLNVYGTPGAVVSYYTFNIARYTKSNLDNAGIKRNFEVYGANGNDIIFSDYSPPLRPLGNVKGTCASPVYPADSDKIITTTAHSSNIKVAVAVNVKCIAERQIYNGTLWMQSFKFNTDSVQSIYHRYRNNGAVTYARTYYDFLLCNVTGL